MREFNWKRGLMGGGIVLGFIVALFYPIVKGHSAKPEVSYDKIHNCLPIPDDVPATFKSGTPIGWDCEMAAYYKNGDLILHYDKDGGLVMIEKNW
jgi:hypothetical protein